MVDEMGTVEFLMYLAMSANILACIVHVRNERKREEMYRKTLDYLDEMFVRMQAAKVKAEIEGR